jgi:menaquinone-dependent protoporphyrinogen oxidase
MRILVTAASKRGSTFEIAEAIAAGLARRGLKAEVRRPAAVRDLDGYDAVVLGSAVYAGRWCDAARDFAERLAQPLAELPTWLFSSGPLGTTDLKPGADPIDAAPMLELTGAESHRVFTGKLDIAGLTFGEKAVVRALHAPVGDFRDWGAIDAYAREIAMRLARRQAPTPPNSSSFPSVR